ncbi:Rpn family recombination-promoting nuclease/putative transposase [Methylovulum psychrotolerans]|uniref:Transposase n=1 Tax=Methylovulum psychrotolerans TaxID=1704499 RepID=A0A2S5CPV0_9GAMM|nr:Rpn family recombination-promoting nuclease/putative transposase [Methylovulum psychrotolerans]POZ52823.1 transposase [Methylovulum psychrotolerans]
MNFLDIKTDFAFKKVFGSEGSQDILLSFLNSVLDFNGRLITDLIFVDPYNIPMLKGMKDTYVDVKAKLDDGSQVIVEMQVLHHEGFEKRILYNAAKNYSAQLSKGEDYGLLNPVIGLTLTDFILFPDQPLINGFKLLEKERFIEYNDDIELVFIELPKFTKTEAELLTIQDKWLYFIKNAGKLDAVPKNLAREQEKAFAIANEANLSAEELDLQHRKRDWIMIQKGAYSLALKQGLEQGMELGIEKGMELGIEKGIEQGIEKGMELGIEKGVGQGIEQNRRLIIANADKAGMGVDAIAAIVQLDAAEVAVILASCADKAQ